jgi:hypothetical protein
MTLVKKKELIELLDRGNEMDQIIFDSVDGEKFAFSDEVVQIQSLRSPFEQLIPKAVWTKQDYVITYSQLSLLGTEIDKENHGQLLIGVEGITSTFITTTEAISQLFEPMNMAAYAHFLLENPSDHYALLNHNFDYWFKGNLANTKVLIRTVIEDGQPIARCFASQRYQQIDNHILLYCTAWVLDKLQFNFSLSAQKITHSKMRLNFLSDEIFEIDGVGTLSYGFAVINSESKTHSVEFLPTCTITNEDGTSVPIVLDRTIKIRHFGKEVKPIVEKILELGNLPDHVQRAIETIKTVKDEKINPLLAYKIQQSIVDIIGKKAFRAYQEKYTQVSSNNTYNLLEFFGRLEELPVDDDDKQILIESLFWNVMQGLAK